MSQSFPDLDKAMDNLKRLAQREGFQRIDLADKIELDLRTIWGITDLDSMADARRKAIAHLERAIGHRVHPAHAQRAREYFNVSDDEEMWPLVHGSRMKRIHDRDGKGNSPSEIQRDAGAQFLDPLRADLAVLLQDWHEVQPAELVAGLRDFAAELHQPERTAGRRMAMFLEITYVIPRSGPDFLLAHTSMRGVWLPVFVNRQSHDSYLKALGISRPQQPARLTGAALLTELHRRKLEVGICVQPEPGTSGLKGMPIAYEWSDVERMITTIL